MKQDRNLHVLPTEHTSRLYYNSQERTYQLCEFPKYHTDIKSTHNLYITSDEEIKEGDWFICLEHSIEDFKFNNEIAQRLVSKQNKELFEGWINGITISDVIGDRLQGNYQIEYCKKIILTTDQDLIKDGVQAIDDEFLEWFVKNSSCESVKVTCYSKFNDGDFSDYKIFEEKLKHINKIIIPKEELSTKLHKGEVVDESYPKKFKQETLVEAALNYSTDMLGTIYEELEKAFTKGAKWQQERSYNEEDMKLAFEAGYDRNTLESLEIADSEQDYRNFDEFIEQFKKK
jgi:hypothetical protein